MNQRVILNLPILREEMNKIKIFTFKKFSKLTKISIQSFARISRRHKDWKTVLVRIGTCNKMIEQIILLSEKTITKEELFEKIFKNKQNENIKTNTVKLHSGVKSSK